MNAAVGVPTGSCVREGHGRLEDRDRVVGEGPDGAAREARHVVPWLNPTSADERSQRCQRIRGIGGPDGKLGVVPIHGDRALLDARLAVADLEQLPWPDAEERVPAQALPALDRLEEVRRRRPVIEPEECADGRLEVGGARRPQEQRVGIASEPLRLGEAERVRRGHVRRLRLSCFVVQVGPRIETTSRPRDERSSLPRCHPHSAMPHFPDRRVRLSTDRSALPAIAGALRRSLLGPAALAAPRRSKPALTVRSGGSRVHSPPPSPRFPPATGSLCRRSTGTRPVRSPYSVRRGV